MQDWRQACGDKLKLWWEAAKIVKSGDKVVANLTGAQPVTLMWALQARKDDLEGVRIYTDFSRSYPCLEWGWEAPCSLNNLFVHRISRQAVRERRMEFVLFMGGLGARPGSVFHGADVGMIKVTPPDTEGYCSFGPEVWFAHTIVKNSRIVIAEIDPQMVWTCGDKVHISEIDFFVEKDPAIQESLARKTADVRQIPLPPLDESERASVVGANIASLIHDGDTIQVGTGTPSESVMEFLRDKNDLGIDSEMVFPAVIDLIKMGVVTNKRKERDRGKTTCTAVYTYEDDPRTPATLEYVNRNPTFQLYDFIDLVNVSRLSSISNLVSINTILGIDLFGQAIVSHLGAEPLSGLGGQFDYIIGSQHSEGGKGISALISVAKQGSRSRIVPQFEAGQVISIPSYCSEYIVTEHGVVNLQGRNRRETAEAIISIAEPKFREELKSAAKRFFTEP